MNQDDSAIGQLERGATTENTPPTNNNNNIINIIIIIKGKRPTLGWEISPGTWLTKSHHAMRDDENAAEVSNVVDAGMDWVSGGINGLQIKRDGDGDVSL